VAVTKLWPIKGWLGHVLIYVEDPNKTKAPKYIKMPDLSDAQAQGLRDVIDYAMATEKTVEVESADTLRCYISGINCTPTDARRQMMATKEAYRKKDGVIAYHGYQSFSPGEVSPAVAHEIGVKLAQQLWGDKFEVVVATHVDKKHVHNHLVFNSVSFVDGHKFRFAKADYRAMRQASDRLCCEYGLSVIQNSQPGKSKHHAEWQAERSGITTWRSLIKTDVDEAIACSMTLEQFFKTLKQMGYEIKQGKDISVRPQGKERFFRLARNFGEGYSAEEIVQRILSHRSPRRVFAKTAFAQNVKIPAVFKGSILSLYKHYLYLLGAYKRQSQDNSGRMHFLIREDLRHLDDLMADEKLLSRENVTTTKQLASFMGRLKTEIGALVAERSSIGYHLRTRSGATGKTKDDPRIKAINKRLRQLRKEVRQCDRIAERSCALAERIECIERQDNNDKRKEGRYGRNRASR
jgi:hypothetical protein